MRRLAVSLALLLAGCGAGDEPDPTGLTPSETDQLNAAAADLDNQAGTLGALEPSPDPAS